jgi:nanoRNase/pAp phosphatase (c-di-AMP/oligoRNAs hydrolase)
MYRVNNLLLVPINNMANRDALSQVADFLLPTEGITTVISFGVRRNKVILSARSSDEAINLGQILEGEFEEGTAGGHAVMAGGQIPFEDLDSDNERDAMDNIASKLKEIFGGE